jgi:hypothetical protein
MKLMDENGRLFGKVSVLDLLVVLVVVVLALALSFKKEQTHTGTSIPQQTITYQILVRGVRSYVVDAVQVGDLLYDQDYTTGGTLGEILDIQTFPGDKMTEMKDGSIEFLEMEDCQNLLITVQGNGILSNGHYQINRIYELGVNASRNYYTPYVQFTGTVMSIEG